MHVFPPHAQVGFTDPRSLESGEIKVQDPELSDLLGNARFFSVTYRWKGGGLETAAFLICPVCTKQDLIR